nr:hypothetical 6.4K protein - tomato aspermy virus [Tomato aspermy virus]
MILIHSNHECRISAHYRPKIAKFKPTLLYLFMEVMIWASKDYVELCMLTEPHF